MGRFSPTVGPYTGPTIGDAIADGLEDVFARRDRQRELRYQHGRQEKQDSLAEALTRARIDDEGVRFGAVPEEAGREIALPRLNEPPDDLAGALQRGMSVGGENEVAGSIFDRPVGLQPTPGFNPNAPPPLASVPLGTFDKRTGTFNRGAPQGPPTAQLPPSGRYRELGQGMYRDEQGTPEYRKARQEDSDREARHSDRLAEILAEGEQRRALAQDGTARTPRDPVQDHKDIRDYDIQHPLPSRAAQGGAPTGALKPVPVAAAKAYITNATQGRTLDRAIASIEANPDAVGWKGYLPGALLDRSGMKGGKDGVSARADVADIGSLVIHDRSGAAVTVSEFPRLRPFIPSANDDSKTVLTKLRRMKGIIEEESAAMASFYTPEQGYRGLGGGGQAVSPPTGGDPRTTTSSGVSQDEYDRARADLDRLRGKKP